MNLDTLSKIIVPAVSFFLLKIFLGISAFFSLVAFSQNIHRAPIILTASSLSELSGFPVESYRVFKSVNGKAEAIPFQIDELTRYEDFVLGQGVSPNTHEGDGVFEGIDELSFMGEDVGEINPVKTWPGLPPDLSFELSAMNENGSKGAVYVGVWFSKPPPLSKRSYVYFDLKEAKILTSRYAYYFDPTNYLVVRGIDLIRDGVPKKLVESSSFFLKADLKYFITFLVNQSSIESKLEAYKNGPIRSIVRVSFSYVLLKLNFEMGMYTEVSFFANSVILPAIMYNPLNGAKSLNKGSGFYYGFSLKENPASLKMASTLPEYTTKRSLSPFANRPAVKETYSVTASSQDWFMQMEIQPSKKMIAKGFGPSLYVENLSSQDLLSRPLDKALPLGKSPVNLAVNFDLSEFDEGEHRVGFKLFFENIVTPEILDSFSNLRKWVYSAKRIGKP
jgi:hypothetical protein